MFHSEENSVWTPQRRRSDALEVYLLGAVDFDSAMFLQDRLHHEIAQRDDGLGTLLICEHPPTVTTGRDGTILDLVADAREFESRQIEIHRVARSGGTILHGPGQVAAWPILPVDRRWNGVRPVEPNRAVADFVRKCTTAVCDMASELNVNATPVEDGAGAECRCGQFAWAGAAIRDGVSSHGLFVNVSPDMLPFRLIRSARSVGSMSMQKMSPVPMPKVRESLMRNLADQFGYEDVHLYTRHPLLTRTTRKVVEYA
jgi:lipoyl(octanoyl) transferase